MSITASIAADLSQLGGILRCTTCGQERPVGDIAGKLDHGWPRCCGYTMSWVTQRLLDEETDQ
jgi:hypothetical protein